MRTPPSLRVALPIALAGLAAGCLERPAPIRSDPKPERVTVAPVSSAAPRARAQWGGSTSDAGEPAEPASAAPTTSDEEEIDDLLLALKRQQEEGALAALKEVAAAQEAHGADGGGPADLAGLIAADRVDGRLAEGKDGYAFAAWTTEHQGEPAWVAVANAIEPGDSGDEAFAVTSAGVVFARPAEQPFAAGEWRGLWPPAGARPLGEWREGALEQWQAQAAAGPPEEAAPTAGTAGEEPASSGGGTGEGTSPDDAPAVASGDAPAGQGPAADADPLATARQRLKSGDAAERRAGAQALGGLGAGAAEAAADLASLVHDADWEVRLAAVQALGAIGPGHDPVLEALTEALEDERAEVRRAAYAALDQ